MADITAPATPPATRAPAIPTRPRGKAYKAFVDGVGANNPVFVQVLGICSTLAVTNVVTNTVVMCLGLVWATTMSNISVSLLRKWIPARVRMIVETLIIAVWVIIVDIVLRAYLPDISRTLGPYVGLIITNCIVMGRTEAFGLANPPGLAAIDGLSAGLGYSYVLLIIAVIRELAGSGSLFGVKLLGSWWTNWSIFVMPSGAFFLLACLIWVVKGVILKERKR
jgi:Na+-transporting NADH:ubiquinone oxidoreductase subunit D